MTTTERTIQSVLAAHTLEELARVGANETLLYNLDRAKKTCGEKRPPTSGFNSAIGRVMEDL